MNLALMILGLVIFAQALYFEVKTVRGVSHEKLMEWVGKLQGMDEKIVDLIEKKLSESKRGE